MFELIGGIFSFAFGMVKMALGLAWGAVSFVFGLLGGILGLLLSMGGFLLVASLILVAIFRHRKAQQGGGHPYADSDEDAAPEVDGEEFTSFYDQFRDAQ